MDTCTTRYSQLMARPLDQAKRNQILAEVAQYMSSVGLADLSLRRMAAELGTSSRMLVYYFGSKEELLMQALATQHPDFASIFCDITDVDAFGSALNKLWVIMISDGPAAKSTRVLLQAMGNAVVRSGPFADYATLAIESLVASTALSIGNLGVERTHAQHLATVLVSGLRGTLMDRLITGDVERADAAATLLISVVVNHVRLCSGSYDNT